MKTVEEFYKEIAGSPELQNELKAASDEMLGAFLKKHGCDADVKDFTAFVRSQSEGEIDDDEAGAVAGGHILDTKAYKSAPKKPFGVV